MSNLGKYQDIVIDAKRVGGVENLIASIESNAVSNAAPWLLGIGLCAGVLGTQAVRWSTHYYKAWRLEQNSLAEAAKARITVVAESQPDSEPKHASTANDGAESQGDNR